MFSTSHEPLPSQLDAVREKTTLLLLLFKAGQQDDDDTDEDDDDCGGDTHSLVWYAWKIENVDSSAILLICLNIDCSALILILNCLSVVMIEDFVLFKMLCTVREGCQRVGLVSVTTTLKTHLSLQFNVLCTLCIAQFPLWSETDNQPVEADPFIVNWEVRG